MKNIRVITIVASVLALAALACSFGGSPSEPPPLVEDESAQPPTAEPLFTEVPATEVPDADAPEKNKPSGETGTTGDLTLEITNQSGVEIWYVYISPAEAEEWGEDWLGGEDAIADGETYIITGIPAGTYDVRAEDPSGEAVEIVWATEITEDLAWTITGVGALEITNASDTDIAYLYISPVESDAWGEDWLGEDVIAVGASYSVEGISSGVYDIKAADIEDENVETLYNVRLSGDNSWTVQGRVDVSESAELVFEDAFDDNRNGWGDGADEGVVYVPPQDGEYCIQIEQEQLTAWEWYQPFETDEFVAEVGCTLAGAGDATCGLGFGPDGDNLYWFEISPFDQSYALFLLENDAWQGNLIDWTSSKNINPTGRNYMSMERIDGVLSVYVNGVWMADVDGQRFPTGRLGIGGSTYGEGDATVCLDNLRVWELQ